VCQCAFEEFLCANIELILEQGLTIVDFRLLIVTDKFKSEESKMQTALTENDELISIFVKSAENTQKNMDR
jgi:hypothetical protein